MNKSKELTKYERLSMLRIKKLINDRCDGSQKKFADKTGLNIGSVSQYVNGKNTPSNLNAEKIAKAFDVSPEWVMGFSPKSNLEKDPQSHRMTEEEKARIMEELGATEEDVAEAEYVYEMYLKADDRIKAAVEALLYSQEGNRKITKDQ